MLPELQDHIDTAEMEMAEAVDFLKREFSHIRAGKATPSLLEGIRLDYYGTQTPLTQMASITAPEARLLVVQPWDKSTIPLIEKGILTSGLGLNPSNDGNVVRIPLPILSEERRQELVKITRDVAEKARVSIRNSRRQANDAIKNTVKKDSLPEDSRFEGEDIIQKLTDQHTAAVEEALKIKEKDILTV